MQFEINSSSVHCVMVPGKTVNVLLPSAAVDEIVSDRYVSFESGGADWFAGFVKWRDIQVPLVSFDTDSDQLKLTADRQSVRVLILNSLLDDGDDTRLAFLSLGNPKTVTVDDAAVEMELPSAIDQRYARAGVNVKGRLAIIPDIKALLDAFPTLDLLGD